MNSFFYIHKRSFHWVSCFMLIACTFANAQKEHNLQVGNLFQDHMVIQRDKPIHLWGNAREGSRVVVQMNEMSSSATTDKNGEWMVELPPISDKGPFKIHISNEEETLVLEDILVGDVWVASGQSNMEWPVVGTNYREKDTHFIDKAEIRLLKIRPEMDYVPRREGNNNGWKTLSKDDINSFSAVAYHFGKLLYKETGVPIGLISANLGATAIETWMSNNTLAKFPQFRELINYKKSFKELRKDFEEGNDSWSKEEYYSGTGLEEEWHKNPYKIAVEWKPIEVAGNTWETIEGLKDFDGVVWFRKKFDLPENFSGDSLNIQLLQIDDFDITWVNGKKVGETFGNHNHRNYSVAISDLHQKENHIAVRVFDAGGIGGFTTSAFWGNNILWGEWEYCKGKEITPAKFESPSLPNATPFSSPGVMYNGTIAQLTDVGIKGVIWYQGESNEARAGEYRDLFPALIRDWRKNFDQGDFPFLFVQLANYREEDKIPKASQWAELREAQALGLEEPNTYMTVTIDIGEAADIHPKNKEDVGKRLGKLALNHLYNRKLISNSPVYSGMKIENKTIIVNFNSFGSTLINKNKYGYVRGFQIAGSDKKFYWAKAMLKNNQVTVKCDKVNNPVAVRYAWSDNPGKLDLYNEEGLPVAPFRTDNWDLSTKGKKYTEGPRF